VDGPEVHDLAGIARDPVLLEEFYLRHFDAVSRFVARRAGDPHSAADLTADVFLAALDSAATYVPGGPGGERAWLFGVARNVVAGERRRSAREWDASRRIAGRRLLVSDDIVRIEEQLDAAEQARCTYLAVEELLEKDRAVLELVVVDGLGIAEAAAVLGLQPVSARVRLHRARRRLKAALGKGALGKAVPGKDPAARPQPPAQTSAQASANGTTRKEART
jgi:RNA polymerase sigma-70 factor (ECF subfamily)